VRPLRGGVGLRLLGVTSGPAAAGGGEQAAPVVLGLLRLAHGRVGRRLHVLELVGEVLQRAAAAA
jgi:hypothetical protein